MKPSDPSFGQTSNINGNNTAGATDMFQANTDMYGVCNLCKAIVGNKVC